MTDYTELVEKLLILSEKNSLSFNKRRVCKDAAAAIEDLQAELEKKRTADCWGCKRDKMEPKRGKWITHPEVKNIYGGVYIECPFCGEKYVVQNVSDEKFCRNCGADLRAKMEVQE